MIKLVKESYTDKIQAKLDQIEKRKQIVSKLESKLSSLEKSGASKMIISEIN